MASPTDATPTPIPVPASTDLSATVSAYIQQHLISTHHMKPTAAHSIAHQHTMHGAELREMKLTRHRKLFGDEIARTLYTEVRTAVLEEERVEYERSEAARPAPGAVRNVKIFCIVTSQGIVTLLYLYVFGFSAGLGMLFFWSFGACMLLIAIVDSLFTPPTPGEPSEVVESELRKEFGG